MLSPTLLSVASIIISLVGVFVAIAAIDRKKSYLKPVEIHLDTNSSTWLIKIKNFGQDVVKNVRVQGMCLTSFKRLNTYSVPAKGISEIGPGEVQEYEFNRFLTFETPLTIKWTTLTGYPQASRWSMSIRNSVDEKDDIKAVSFFAFFYYHCMRYCLNFFNRFKKDSRDERYPILRD